MMEQLAVARAAREEQNEADLLADTEDEDYEKEYVVIRYITTIVATCIQADP